MFASLLWLGAGLFIVLGLTALAFGAFGAGMASMLVGVGHVIAADYAHHDVV